MRRRGPVPFLPVSLKVYQKVPFTSKCPSRHASILLFPFHLRPPPTPPRSPIVLAAPGEGRASCQRERNRRERKELETKREAGIAPGPAPAGAVTPSPPACCLAVAPGDGAGRGLAAPASAVARGSARAPVATDGFSELQQKPRARAAGATILLRCPRPSSALYTPLPARRPLVALGDPNKALWAWS